MTLIGFQQDGWSIRTHAEQKPKPTPPADQYTTPDIQPTLLLAGAPPCAVATVLCGRLVGTEDFGMLTTVITSRGVPSAYSCHTGSTLVLYRDMLFFFSLFVFLIEDINRTVTTRIVYSCCCYTVAIETQSQSVFSCFSVNIHSLAPAASFDPENTIGTLLH